MLLIKLIKALLCLFFQAKRKEKEIEEWYEDDGK
ncbi:hypothetical protein BATR1942_03915 [Bacillus atrophaeus 1942]|uniref:Uncharacterized protein n=1 Tax=Bacillus atrophaeus (strain 1942) TaxID=720555 RepID=A0ABN3ZAF6_BACA1|nr:hypothetical protein BATR1942_03915 [Bacillus atrophaeus 1942]